MRSRTWLVVIVLTVIIGMAAAIHLVAGHRARSVQGQPAPHALDQSQ